MRREMKNKWVDKKQDKKRGDKTRQKKLGDETQDKQKIGRRDARPKKMGR